MQYVTGKSKDPSGTTQASNGGSEVTNVAGSGGLPHNSALQGSFPHTLPQAISGIRSRNSARVPTIQNLTFRMYLDDREGREIHMYTSVQSEIGAAPKDLESVDHWQEMFPALSPYLHQGLPNCEMVFCESNLAITTEYPHSKSALGLRIDFDVNVSHGSAFKEWECRTTFYENGSLGKKFTKTLEDSQVDTKVGSTVVQLPLECVWWRDLFFKIMQQRQRSEIQGDLTAMLQEDENARRYIREMSVMQEISAIPSAGGQEPQLMIIVLWRFRRTRGEAATTTWRRINTPASPNQRNLPVITSSAGFMQPAAPSGSCFHNTLADYPGPIHTETLTHSHDYLNEISDDLIHHEASLTSPRSTPGLDFQSFPSSTSTNFPSSISNPNIPLSGSQDQPPSPQGPAFSQQGIPYPSPDTIDFPEADILDLSSHAIAPKELPSNLQDFYQPQDPSIRTHNSHVQSQNAFYPSYDHDCVRESTAYNLLLSPGQACNSSFPDEMPQALYPVRSTPLDTGLPHHDSQNLLLMQAMHDEGPFEEAHDLYEHHAQQPDDQLVACSAFESHDHGHGFEPASMSSVPFQNFEYEDMTSGVTSETQIFKASQNST